MNQKQKMIIGIGVVVIAAIAFYGGARYSQAKTAPTSAATARGQYGQGGFAQGGARAGGAAFAGRGGATAGEILSKDATSFTVKLSTGGSRIVFTSASTTVAKMAQGSLDDLTVGASVLVTGTPNSDGSMTASSVELRPMPASR